MAERARVPGDRGRSYLLEWHIIQAVAPHPAYHIENGFDSPLSQSRVCCR